VISQRLREKIKEIENVTVDHGVLDITLYRDDLADGIHKP
jgi:pyrimidine operon attenuation protein/uracil phosphoribosyltransferase